MQQPQFPNPKDDETVTGGEDIPEELPIFEIEEDILVRYNGEDENVIIPDGIREIGSKAFYENQKIQSVMLPDSVEIRKQECP